MALIPPDVGIRMRMQTDANLLQPVRPAHDIGSDLPELRQGQTFTARIQEVLPDNSYKALVAGKQLTLQLPEGAKTGDELELVVVDRAGRTIMAKQVETGQTGSSAPYEFARFSTAGRMISNLLPDEGNASVPARLNRGEPLLPAPPSGQNAAAQLAPILAKSVAQSGLFYESHQAQWVNGQRPLAQLFQEPQGQHARADGTTRTGILADRAALPGMLPAGGAEKVGAGGTAPAAQIAQAAQAASPVPDDLRPLVQQQLETLATQRMTWHGEVWPQQAMDLTIELENERETDGSEDESPLWSTTLSLTTPRLGRVDAKLQLTAQGMRITLATPYGASAADLLDEAPALAKAMEAAGVPLIALQVKHEAEPARP
ncbi:MAG: flagellar hook-length control protein FliK [Rhodocyclaceae bacterium]|nr:flagellar hook-length control protein FliK [Rhodocyclaceae bacterium]MDZ4215264.1 flagellar hook-length control protein FliK [Rhodocyclaceae bacterium]